MNEEKRKKSTPIFAIISNLVGIVSILICYAMVVGGSDSGSWYGRLPGMVILIGGFVVSMISSFVSFAKDESPSVLRIYSYLILLVMFVYSLWV